MVEGMDSEQGNNEESPAAGPRPVAHYSSGSPEPGSALRGMMVFATVIAWGIVTIIAFVQQSDFNEQTQDRYFDAPSAVQVSQLADEVLVTVLPWLLLALGVTALTVCAHLLSIRDRLDKLN